MHAQQTTIEQAGQGTTQPETRGTRRRVHWTKLDKDLTIVAGQDKSINFDMVKWEEL